ncbi:TIGR03767 family metallophosphoesterase [Actinospongicola halichondriae]|uniref:TIGR03767 family metallophosphoesterase n=1 Tax=Actinospongicola halichondriae TaxID=3236844 RepID=UPI003D540C6C
MGNRSGTHSSFTRRRFIAGLGVVAATPVVWDPVRAAAQQRAQIAAVTDPTGTTLEFSIARPSGAGYVKLVEAEPYPQIVREELAAAKSDREARRVGLATIVHLTDVHIVDAQSPSRVEFVDRLASPVGGGFRPQETMSTQVGSAMVQRINTVAAGPVTGRAFDVAVSTGDNIDNQQRNELDWFVTLLDGGTVVPDSGAAGTYEGVQDDDVGLGYYNNYWHPDAPPGSNPPDSYKAAFGFPELPGLLSAAVAAHDSPGLGIPWYSTYGNHDGLLQGNVPGELPGAAPFDPIATGPIKVTGVGTSFDPSDLQSTIASALDPAAISSGGALFRVVTADPSRASATLEDWIRRHLASTGPGPVGHGYDEDMIASRRLYYTFPVGDSVLGISLDTVNHGGYAEGSLGDAQLAWLEMQLASAHSSYVDSGGTTVTTGNADRLVVLFSHHNLFTLSNPFPDPFDPTEGRQGFDVLRAMLSRFPNVVAWVNGHSHVNRITPVADPSGRTGGFWEISTAAHIDWPEQARLIEIADNRDGTLSIFGTLIEHASPASVDLTDPSTATATQLASLSRELSANEPQADANALGEPGARNVELLIGAPFEVTPGPSPAPTTTTLSPAEPGGPSLPATGGSTSGLVAGTVLGAAAAGALAWRRRTEPPIS